MGRDDPTDDPFMFYGICRQNSDDPEYQIMSEDGTQVFFDSEENAQALQYLIDLSKKDKVMPEGSIKWADGPSNFMAGAASITFTSSGSLTNILDNTDFEVGTAFLPAGKQYGSATGGAIYILKTLPLKSKRLHGNSFAGLQNRNVQHSGALIRDM